MSELEDVLVKVFLDRVMANYTGPDIVYRRAVLKSACVQTLGPKQWRKTPKHVRDALYELAINHVESEWGWAISTRTRAHKESGCCQ